MSNYNVLKAAIQDAVKENGNNEITGALLQQTLLAMVNSLGDNYQLRGVAVRTTNPGVPDQKVFYFATEVGDYPNFVSGGGTGSLSVAEGEVAIFKFNGTSWSKEVSGFASSKQKADAVYSKNLFDASKVEEGHFIWAWGGIGDNASYGITDYIPVGSNIIINQPILGGMGANVYDASKVKLRTITTPNYTYEQGDAFVRYTILLSNIPTIQIEVGNTSTDYEPFTDKMDVYNLSKEYTKNSIAEENAKSSVMQYLKVANKTAGRFWNVSGSGISYIANSNCSYYAPFRLKANVAYQFIDVYGYFCLIKKADNSVERLTTNQTTRFSGVYTPTEDVDVYVSIMSEYAEVSAMVIDNIYIKPVAYVEGAFLSPKDRATRLEGITNDLATEIGAKIDIVVKKDGTGDYTKVIDAVNYANTLADGKNNVNVHIYDGEYDLFQELGGQTWLNNNPSPTHYIGLFPKEKVNLIGHGLVILYLRLPSTINQAQGTNISCLVLSKTSNKIENIIFVAKNTRYVCHDESDGANVYVNREVSNCTFIMEERTAEYAWQYLSAYGAGTCSGGGHFSFKNNRFITKTYGNGMSYHTNNGAKPMYFDIDGCVSVISSAEGISFGCQSYGTGHIGKTFFSFKNCTGNGNVVNRLETQSSQDHIIMTNNGYNKISNEDAFALADSILSIVN